MTESCEDGKNKSEGKDRQSDVKASKGESRAAWLGLLITHYSCAQQTHPMILVLTSISLFISPFWLSCFSTCI